MFENKEDAIIFCEQLKALVKMQEKSTEKGVKHNSKGASNGGIFDLYLNEITHTN